MGKEGGWRNRIDKMNVRWRRDGEGMRDKLDEQFQTGLTDKRIDE